MGLDGSERHTGSGSDLLMRPSMMNSETQYLLLFWSEPFEGLRGDTGFLGDFQMIIRSFWCWGRLIQGNRFWSAGPTSR